MTGPAEVPHGTRTRYRKGCRCEQCTEANRAYTAYRRRLASVVEPDPGEVRAHLDRLVDAGLGLGRIAQLAGVTKRTVVRIQAGAVPKVDTANRILTVPTELANGALVDGTDTWRMVDALIDAKGLDWLAAQFSPPRKASNLVRARRPKVRLATAQKVANLYAGLGLPPLDAPAAPAPPPAPRKGPPVSDVAAAMLDMEPTPWKSLGACRADIEVNVGTPPVRLRIDARWWTSGEQEDTEKAKAVCATCPVRPECLAHALAWPERYFIWGGTTARERRRMRAGGRGARVETWESEEEGAA